MLSTPEVNSRGDASEERQPTPNPHLCHRDEWRLRFVLRPLYPPIIPPDSITEVEPSPALCVSIACFVSTVTFAFGYNTVLFPTIPSSPRLKFPPLVCSPPHPLSSCLHRAQPPIPCPLVSGFIVSPRSSSIHLCQISLSSLTAPRIMRGSIVKHV
jgi:hypothetical protein